LNQKEETMSRVSCIGVLRNRGAACVMALVVVGSGANGQLAVAADSGTPGRIEFDDTSLPPATVEIDLQQSMFHDLFGLGDAAVAGVAETLLQSAGSDSGSEGLRLAAEQLQAARQILQLASDVVHEVRVRVYENLPSELGQPATLVAPYDGQLRAGNWDTVVQVRDGDDSVRVSLLRESGAVRGVFIVAADGSDLVLANVVCDASPENVKKLTSAAAKIGLENGLGKEIEAKMRRLHQRLPPASPQPPRDGELSTGR
jgi:hypothetical protein